MITEKHTPSAADANCWHALVTLAKQDETDRSTILAVCGIFCSAERLYFA